MPYYDPHQTIRALRKHLREHLFCASILTVFAILLGALLYSVLTYPFVARQPVVQNIMQTFGVAAGLLLCAGSVLRAAADLWQALTTRREIQSHSWATLSLRQLG